MTPSKNKAKTLWVCQECGTSHPKWAGSCSACAKWNTLVEESVAPLTRFQPAAVIAASPMTLSEVSFKEKPRYSTRFPQWDRLLGGGCVVGCLGLIAGDPGIGKSTLMLQLSAHLALEELKVLYVCGEESVEQTAIRAKRLGIVSSQIYFLSETNFELIQAHIEKLSPQIVIIDSIQILYKPDIPSAPGSVTQVRELALSLMHLAKKMHITTFVVGHVTKSGEVAGPRVLEHIVDVVLEFEGDYKHGYRILRAVKNRFGPTDDIVLFQMRQEGLSEVENPSQLFLEERIQESTGSVIVPTMEGSRPFLIEVQALVASSAFATSSRKSTGLDPNRLSLLLAVLEKRMGYMLHRSDVFVSVTGGIKIIEPGIDLAVLMAISSSFCNRAVDPDTVVIGEVGLGGEVRSVSRIETRLKEAAQMGFKRCIIPQRNLKGIQVPGIEILGVDKVEQAIEYLKL
ncbi:DNA repair protein RadA [Rhabdochlamydiaceae symbiont of Dictyostelium giganteum]|uniref:DNA repair protein RadA n=1 Tax=Rhabdochlamydiaceae symbiont of Dictyostelium giganteum TaxID=3342349 RepID=UPI00384A4774